MNASCFASMVIAAFISLSSSAFACSPIGELTPQSLIEEADRIFVGTAVRSYWEVDNYSQDPDDEPIEIVTTHFKVRKILKGPKTETIKIEHLFPIYGNCGVAFAPSETVLVMARHVEGGDFTDIILLGQSLSKEQRGELLTLLNIEEPKPFSRFE